MHQLLGIGLYLAPSDMELHMGNVQGYNNEVIIAVSDAVIGHNQGINESEPISGTKGDKAFQRKIAPPGRDYHQGTQDDEPSSSRASTGTTPEVSSPPVALQQQRRKVKAHEEEKTALVTAGIVLGLVAL